MTHTKSKGILFYLFINNFFFFWCPSLTPSPYDPLTHPSPHTFPYYTLPCPSFLYPTSHPLNHYNHLTIKLIFNPHTYSSSVIITTSHIHTHTITSPRPPNPRETIQAVSSKFPSITYKNIGLVTLPLTLPLSAGCLQQIQLILCFLVSGGREIRPLTGR